MYDDTSIHYLVGAVERPGDNSSQIPGGDRSAIVNLDRVKEVIPWFKRSHKLRLTTGAEVELSRAQARMLRKLLDW